MTDRTKRDWKDRIRERTKHSSGLRFIGELIILLGTIAHALSMCAHI